MAASAPAISTELPKTNDSANGVLTATRVGSPYVRQL
jgi:hypothetical protein